MNPMHERSQSQSEHAQSEQGSVHRLDGRAGSQAQSLELRDASLDAVGNALVGESEAEGQAGEAELTEADKDAETSKLPEGERDVAIQKAAEEASQAGDSAGGDGAQTEEGGDDAAQAQAGVEGQPIEGTFKASSGFGAALERSGGQAHSCVLCAAGTNSWAKPGGFPGTLGLTTVTNAFAGPSFDLDIAERTTGSGKGATKEYVATVKPTTSTDATHPCVSSPAGDHKTGTQAVMVGGKPVTYDTIQRITGAYATKIWNAEDEHLSDVLRAYNISLKKGADEINAMATAKTEYVGASEADAKAAAQTALTTAMPAKLGGDPANWRTAVWSLCLMTISGRDALGYHTFHTPAPTVDHAKKQIVTGLTDGTTQIGTHSSASVVTLAGLP